MYGGCSAERYRADDDTLGEAIGAFSRPAGDERYDLVIGWGDQLGVRGVLLGRNTFLGNEEPLLNSVEILLPTAIEGNLIAWIYIKKIFEYFPIAAHVPSQHDIAALARVGRTTMLADGVLGNLPNPTAWLFCCSTSQPTSTT